MNRNDGKIGGGKQMNIPVGAKPIFEFIKHPEFGEMEKHAPASKIIFSIYNGAASVDQLQDEFNRFLRACGYIVEEENR